MATKAIPINSAKVSGSHSDMPVYLKPSSMTGWGSLTTAEANSIRFYSDSGLTTELAREVVSADEIHVKVPSLTTTTTIYADYDGVRADYAVGDTYGRNAVWSDYEAVYHLEDLTLDSTENGITLTAFNSPANPSAKLGEGVDHGTLWNSAVTPKYLANDTASFGVANGAVTMSTWVKLNTETTANPQNGDFAHYVRRNASGSVIRIGYEHNSGTRRIFLNRTGSANNFIHINGALGTSDWHKVTLTYDGTDFWGYKNATPTSKTASSGTASLATTPAVRIGSQWYTNPPAAINDEVRYRVGAITDDWETTEYNNQSDVATFWGTVTDAGGAAASTGFMAFM